MSKKKSIICVRVGYKKMSLLIPFRLHSARVVMPRFFYPTLTLVIDSYIVPLINQHEKIEHNPVCHKDPFLLVVLLPWIFIY